VSIDYLDFTDMQIRTLSAAVLRQIPTSVFKDKKAVILSHNSVSQRPKRRRQKMFLMKSSRNGRQTSAGPSKLRIGFQKSPRYARKRPYRTVRLKCLVAAARKFHVSMPTLLSTATKASAADVRHVIVHIQKTVFEKLKVLLEPEVIFVGSLRTAV